MPDFGRWPASGGDPSLNEINRADRFIDALSTSQPAYSTDSAEAELAFLFADWRDEVRTAPVTAPVTDRDAVEALYGTLTNRRRRSRGSLALVGSVAAAMLCVGGFGAAVYGAGPGDSLYGMRSSLFGTQQVTRDDQVSLASAQLQQVQQLIDQGQWQQAQDKLVAVSSAVQGVDQVESKQQLVEQWNALTYKVVEQNPAATLPPGQPLPELPSSPLTWLPVPVVEATTTTETTVTSTVSPSDVTTSSSTSPATDSSGSPVPPGVLLTTTPDGATSTTPSPTTSSPATTSSANSTPPSSAAPSPAAAPTTTTPPPPTTTTTTTAAATTTAPATTRPVQTAPASPAPSSSKPEATVPAGETVATSAPLASNTPSVPASPASPASIPQQSSAAAVVTTTVVPPR